MTSKSIDIERIALNKLGRFNILMNANWRFNDTIANGNDRWRLPCRMAVLASLPCWLAVLAGRAGWPCWLACPAGWPCWLAVLAGHVYFSPVDLSLCDG